MCVYPMKFQKRLEIRLVILLCVKVKKNFKFLNRLWINEQYLTIPIKKIRYSLDLLSIQPFDSE